MENISIIKSQETLNAKNSELILINKEDLKNLGNEQILNYITTFSPKNSKVCSIENNCNSNDDDNNNKLIIFSILEDFKDNTKISDEILKLVMCANSSYENVSFSIPISQFSEEIQKEIIFTIYNNTYTFDKYLSEKKSITNMFQIQTSLSQREISIITQICIQQSYCKDLVNSNADEITSHYLEQELQEFSNAHNLRCTSIIGEELLKQNHNLHYAVGKSARVPPRLLSCEYRGDTNSQTYIALVGKGVTFDTGGLNLKPTGSIEEMKIDMGGAATLFSTFKALVKLGIKKNIVLVLGCCENSIDSLSYKVGDVFTSKKGITVEVTNTDAEGRLVLADCLTYVQENYNVEEIIDCATLTGACMVALGCETVGTFTNNQELCTSFLESSKQSNESFWQLPITKEHRGVLQSQIADCSNCGMGAKRRYGGASSAAAFLEKFIEEGVKWIHLDIAGPCYDSKTLASAVAIRSLVEFYLNKS